MCGSGEEGRGAGEECLKVDLSVSLGEREA